MNIRRAIGKPTAFAAALCLLLTVTSAFAETLRIGAQKTGTFGWELDVIKARGLDKAAGLDLQIVDLANTEAGKIAMAGGSVDIILSDWLWVSRERALGRKLTFSPYSSALGALMAKSGGPVATLADLEGKTLGVAGGPLDKSWLLLQAFAKRGGLDVAHQASVVFAAPPLLARRRNKANSTRRCNSGTSASISKARVSSASSISPTSRRAWAQGSVAMVGYVFDEDFAARNPETLAKFLAIARQAKEALASDASLWPDIMNRSARRIPTPPRFTGSATAKACRAARSARRRPTRASCSRRSPRSAARNCGPGERARSRHVL